MLLQDNERYVFECSLQMQPYPDNAPNIPLERCVPHLIQLINDGKAVYVYQKDTCSLRITDYEYSDGYLSLLLQIADKKASDPAFSDFDTGKTRTEKKRDNEGIAATAHLVIATKPSDEDFPNMYDAVLEEVSGVTKTVVSQALTKFFDEATDFDFINQDNGRKIRCRPRASLQSHPSHALSEMLKKGWVTGFSVVKNRADDRLDEYEGLSVEAEQLTIKVEKRSRAEKALEQIKRLQRFAIDSKYSKVIVKYLDSNRRHKSLSISAREDNIADKFFSKSDKITLETDIEQCQKRIHEEFDEKLCEKLAKMAI
ncbi:hypothetical protein H4F26_21930 [Vibrio alginolyticus]|uniref:hypothetical protein n=1 Tax=Vibrio alginolyticus TaxID=663 RepID=UPI002FF06C48